MSGSLYLGNHCSLLLYAGWQYHHGPSHPVGYQPIALRSYFLNYSSPGVTPSPIHKSYHFITCTNHYYCFSSLKCCANAQKNTFLDYTHGVPQHRACSSRNWGWARLSSSLQSVKIFGLSRAGACAIWGRGNFVIIEQTSFQALLSFPQP